MSSSVGIGRISMGDAFRKSYNEVRDRKRRQEVEDEDRAWKNEDREAVRTERANKNRLNTEMRDAMAPRVTMSGTVTQGADGKVFSASPENAAAMQETLAAEAELRGEDAPKQEAGTAVTGRMSKGHEITTGGQKATMAGAAINPNDPAARDERALEVLRANGQWKEAMAMENSIMDQKAKRMGLELAKYKVLDERVNRSLMESLTGGGGPWYQNAADMISSTSTGALKDFKAEAKLSADGKTVEMFAVKPDGTKQSTGVYPADDQGMAQYLEKFSRLPIETRLRFDADRRKETQEQANKDRDFDLRKKDSESTQEYRNRTLNIQQQQETRLQQTHAATMEDAKIPPAVKAEAALLADQIKSISTALNKSMAEGMFDPNDSGTQRLLEQQAALRLKYGQTINPYKPGAAASADPLGLNKPAAAAPGQRATAPAAAPAAAPAGPMASQTRVSPDVQAARDRDRLSILQSELAAAQQRLASGDPRAQGDVQSLQAELGRMGVTAKPVMTQAAMPAQAAPQAAPMAAATAQPQAAAPAQVSQPAATMQAAQPAQPTVADVLAGPSASPAIVATVQQRASEIETLAAEVKGAQAEVVQAAKGGDQAGVKAAMDRAAAASKKLRDSLKGMNQQQASLVIKAAGLQ